MEISVDTSKYDTLDYEMLSNLSKKYDVELWSFHFPFMPNSRIDISNPEIRKGNSFDNPQYSSDYWRGPTWLNVAYFAAKGHKNYNFYVADKIKENILDMCYQNKDGIYENYDSITGRGLCCNHFSWSCVFIIEFILGF